MNNLQSIVSHFNTKGTVNEIQPLGSGLINDTYKVTTLEADAPDYVLQRVNHAIFQNVEMLQANIEAVTRHIRKKLVEQGADDIDRKVLSFIPADTGKAWAHEGLPPAQRLDNLHDRPSFAYISSSVQVTMSTLRSKKDYSILS